MDNNIIKFIQQQQHSINSPDDNDYATTQRQQQQCNNAPTTTTNAICMWYHFTRLNDKAFQGMSPQQFEWLKHSRA